MSSAGISNLPKTSFPVDNFHDRALWCKSTGINYNMHGWILSRYCATGWFWRISGLRAVTMFRASQKLYHCFLSCWQKPLLLLSPGHQRLGIEYIWSTGPLAHFTNGFTIAIQIQWKFRFTLTSILIQWSPHNFVHGTTAVLSVAIWWPATELWQVEGSIEFELRAKKR